MYLIHVNLRYDKGLNWVIMVHIFNITSSKIFHILGSFSFYTSRRKSNPNESGYIKPSRVHLEEWANKNVEIVEWLNKKRILFRENKNV